MATRAEESTTYAAAAGHSGMQLGGAKRNPKEGTRPGHGPRPKQTKSKSRPFLEGKSSSTNLLYKPHMGI